MKGLKAKCDEFLSDRSLYECRKAFKNGGERVNNEQHFRKSGNRNNSAGDCIFELQIKIGFS